MTTATRARAADARGTLVPIGTPVAELVDDLPRPDDVPAEPYRGISPFRVADEHVFFGRADEVLQLLRLVSVYRGVLLYGDTGAGKSSLVNAGFIPAAIRNGYWPERLRVRREPTPSLLVERVVCGTSGAPRFLPSMLLTEGESASAREVALSPQELLHRVRAARTARPLLIFDQFEEAVTLFEAVSEDGAAADFLSELYTVLRTLVTDGTHSIEMEAPAARRERTPPVKILFSFREDYLAKLSVFFDTVPALTDHALRITPPALECLDVIITGPLKRFEGRLRKDGATTTLPEAVTTRVATEFRARVGTGRMVPSEVQIVCQALWRSRDPVAMLQGGLKGILERFLDDAIEGYARAQERDAAVALLSRMVTDAGTRNIVSESDLLADVRKETGVAEPRLRAILHDFDGHKTRLVRREQPRDIAFYTIASEFLVPRIRDWRVQRAEARHAATLRRRLTIGAGAVLGVLLLLGTLYVQRQRAETERQRALLAEIQMRAAQDSLTLANAANRDSLAAVKRRIDALGSQGSALSVIADSLFRTARTADELRRALDAERRARRQSDARVEQVRLAVDSLDAIASRNALNVAELTAERDGLRRQLAAAGVKGGESSLVDSLRLDLRRLMAQFGEAERQRDQLLDSRERWLPVVLRAQRSSDDEERDFANAVCRVDPWNCAPVRRPGRVGATAP